MLSKRDATDKMGNVGKGNGGIIKRDMSQGVTRNREGKKQASSPLVPVY
jgi:hypothetical protein